MNLTMRDLERNAWQRGDRQLAELAAIATDTEETEEELYQAQQVIEGIRERISGANYRTGKKAELLELIEEIIGELPA